MNSVTRKEVMLHMLYSMMFIRQGSKECLDHDKAFLEWCRQHSDVIKEVVNDDAVEEYGRAVYAEMKKDVMQGVFESFLEKASATAIRVAA